MIQETIEAKINEALNPDYLRVENESYMHNVAPGAESHFKLVVVSRAFEGQRLLARHRQINSVLMEELAGGVHALSMHTYTPEEWQERQEAAPNSPQCMGRSRK